MGWRLSRGVADFARAVTALLEADPVGNTVALTVLDALVEAVDTTDPGAAPGSLFGWYVPPVPDGEGERPSARRAVLMTPPYPVLLAAVPRGTERELAAVLRREGLELTGATGTPRTVDRFAAGLAVLGACSTHIRMRQRLYALDRVTLPQAPGAPRRGAAQDAPLITSWYEDFCAETVSREADLATDVARRLGRRGVAVGGPTGVPVSFAARRPVVSRTARVGLCTRRPRTVVAVRPRSDRLVVRFEPEAGGG